MTEEEKTEEMENAQTKKTTEKEETPPVPFSEKELKWVVFRVQKIIDVVLAERRRLSRTVKDGRLLIELSLLFLMTGLLFAIPFGALSPASNSLDVTILFCGSVLLCYPSLHVFSRFLGFESGALQNLMAALTICASAAVISLGFAPIIWFIDYTGGGGEEALEINTFISVLLLSVCFFLGVVHMARTFLWTRMGDFRAHLHQGFMLAWMVLLGFITIRMAVFLELF